MKKRTNPFPHTKLIETDREGLKAYRNQARSAGIFMVDWMWEDKGAGKYLFQFARPEDLTVFKSYINLGIHDGISEP